MRMFIRVYIRILPVATSARLQIRTSAFYPRPMLTMYDRPLAIIMLHINTKTKHNCNSNQP